MSETVRTERALTCRHVATALDIMRPDRLSYGATRFARRLLRVMGHLGRIG